MTSYNPKKYISGSVDVVSMGRLASAWSANTLMGDFSHLAGRQMPIYTLQPTTPVAGRISLVHDLSSSVYPTHGLWQSGSYDDVMTSFTASMCTGFIREQSAVGATYEFKIKVQMPEFTVGEFGDGNNIVDRFSLGASASHYIADRDGDAVGTSYPIRIVARSQGTPAAARAISGDVFDPWGYTALYGDIGHFQFSSRDLASPLVYELERQVRQTRGHHMIAGQASDLIGDDIIGQDNGQFMSSTIGGEFFTSEQSATWSNIMYYIPHFSGYAVNNNDPDTDLE